MPALLHSLEEVETVSVLKLRPIKRCKRIALVPLGGKHGAGRFATIDIDDVPRVAGLFWYAYQHKRTPSIYAQANVKRGGRWTTVQMHKLLLNAAEVDHVDGDGLNNRRKNLRSATPTQNKQNRPIQRNNRSGFRGVTFLYAVGKWMARIGSGKRSERTYLGVFDNPMEAARAYDKEARRRFGKFARLNYPRKNERSAKAVR